MRLRSYKDNKIPLSEIILRVGNDAIDTHVRPESLVDCNNAERNDRNNNRSKIQGTDTNSSQNPYYIVTPLVDLNKPNLLHLGRGLTVFHGPAPPRPSMSMPTIDQSDQASQVWRSKLNQSQQTDWMVLDEDGMMESCLVDVFHAFYCPRAKHKTRLCDEFCLLCPFG